jgi:predicted site-specific integrase-resolvase
MPDKMTKKEAAEFLGVKPKTLANWLAAKKGPPSYKYLGRVYFDKKDLEAFKRSITERRAS